MYQIPQSVREGLLNLVYGNQKKRWCGRVSRWALHTQTAESQAQPCKNTQHDVEEGDGKGRWWWPDQRGEEIGLGCSSDIVNSSPVCLHSDHSALIQCCLHLKTIIKPTNLHPDDCYTQRCWYLDCFQHASGSWAWQHKIARWCKLGQKLVKKCYY